MGFSLCSSLCHAMSQSGTPERFRKLSRVIKKGAIFSVYKSNLIMEKAKELIYQQALLCSQSGAFWHDALFSIMDSPVSSFMSHFLC